MMMELLRTLFSGRTATKKEQHQPSINPTNKPSKYDCDVKSLIDTYGSDVKDIDIELKDLLVLCPRERPRIDAYTGLCSFLRKNYGIELNITSRKTKVPTQIGK